MRRTRKSIKLFHRAQSLIPGGVNSPLRAFKSVGRSPLFIKKASAAFIWDVDGNKFIDYVGSAGPMILGHANPGILRAVRMTSKLGTSYSAPTELEVRMAELITRLVPSIEMVRMVNSGTEATMSAIRLARAHSHKSKIIRFEGGQHGHSDALLTHGIGHQPGSSAEVHPGVPSSITGDTLTATFNDIGSVQRLLDAHKDEVAAVIVEPILSHAGCIPPLPGFLGSLRELCTANGILLIFDEISTGFRVALGGAQELYGVRPDLTTLGKILGGGLPAGAYGGRRDIMQMVSPAGATHQSGTLAGNPLAMAAGYQMLRILSSNKLLYKELEEHAAMLELGMREELYKTTIPFSLNRVGSMYALFFATYPVADVAAARRADTDRFSRFFNAMLEEGVYLPPSQFETAFISTAHTPRIIDRTIRAFRNALRRI